MERSRDPSVLWLLILVLDVSKVAQIKAYIARKDQNQVGKYGYLVIFI